METEKDGDGEEVLVLDSDDWGDPFACSSEWASEEDDAAFADL